MEPMSLVRNTRARAARTTRGPALPGSYPLIARTTRQSGRGAAAASRFTAPPPSRFLFA